MHLSYDQYGNDQIVVLSYYESDGQRVYGLGFHERPDEFDMDATLSVQDMADGPDKEERLQRLLAEGVFGVQRMFVGCNLEGELVVSLHDSKGRQRLRIKVDVDDAPRIETMDEEGHVASSLMPSGGDPDAQDADESIHEQLAEQRRQMAEQRRQMAEQRRQMARLRRQMAELGLRLEQLGGHPVT